MKKRAILLGVVWVLSASALTGCGSAEDSTEKVQEKSTEKEQEKSTDPSKLQSYKDVLDVLCESKLNNDVDAFLNLFDYMRDMMESVVTEDDYFSTIAAGYKEACGDNITWSYEITGAVKADAQDIADYQEGIKLFAASASIDEAYDITAKVHLKGDSGSRDYDLEVSVGKVGDKWQIVNFGETLLQ